MRTKKWTQEKCENTSEDSVCTLARRKYTTISAHPPKTHMRYYISVSGFPHDLRTQSLRFMSNDPPNNHFRVLETAMNHHRVPIYARKLHMHASLTQCSAMKYVHVRVTNAFWCSQDVSHWDIQAVEVIVDCFSKRPSSATPWRCVLRKRLL